MGRLPRSSILIRFEEVKSRLSPKGHPEPVVKWKKDGDNLHLTSSKRIKIDERGNLVIYKGQKKDQGRYQCSAVNTASIRTTKPIRMRVHDPPFFVVKPQDSSV